jgi:hypothetical protein
VQAERVAAARATKEKRMTRDGFMAECYTTKKYRSTIRILCEVARTPTKWELFSKTTSHRNRAPVPVTEGITDPEEMPFEGGTRKKVASKWQTRFFLEEANRL